MLKIRFNNYRIMQFGLKAKCAIIGVLFFAAYFGFNELSPLNIVTVNSNATAFVNFSFVSINNIIEALAGIVTIVTGLLVVLRGYLDGWSQRRKWKDVVIKAKGFLFSVKN